MKITKVSDRFLAEAHFAQLMNTIAAKHGCTCRIDWRTYTVFIDGPENKKEAIARELDKFF